MLKEFLGFVVLTSPLFLVALLLPVSDEIAGRIYFNYLCKTQAGAKVYQTIKLPAEYWDETGKARFYLNWSSHLGKKYPLIYTPGKYSTLLHIDNAEFKFVDKKSGRVLGEVINFRYGGASTQLQPAQYSQFLRGA